MTETLMSLKPGLFSDHLMAEVRERFCHVESDPFSGRRVYLENAGGALTLKSVIDVVTDIASLPDNSARYNDASKALGQLMQNARRDVATFLGATDGVIVSGESTTANVFRILDAVTRNSKGDNIVCTSLDHPSCYDGTRYYAEMNSLEWRVAGLDPATTSVPAEAIASLVDEGTVAVTFIHASNITGAKNDAAAIVRAIREKAPQAIIIADGAQHAQHCAIDVAALGVDAYVFSAYKVFTKPGISFAYLGPRIATIPHPRLRGNAADSWDVGTRDASGFAAFSAVMDYFGWLSAQFGVTSDNRREHVLTAMRAIEDHEQALTDRLLNGTDQLPGLLAMDRVQICGIPAACEDRESLVAFTVDGMEALDVVKGCIGSGVIVHDRQSDAYSRHTLQAIGIDACVRVSLGHYTTPDEVDVFLNTLQEVIR